MQNIKFEKIKIFKNVFLGEKGKITLKFSFKSSEKFFIFTGC